MGRSSRFTGSKLLGSELRRLRGGRSLKQIAELSKSPPLSERIAPVAAPTLSQIENGISFPSVETLHALAHVYRKPVQQLLDLVLQERLAARSEDHGSEASALESYRKSHEGSAWSDALAAALAGESLAGPGTAPLWRIRRALCLQELGMEQDALDLLMDVLEDPGLPAERNTEARLQVANALARLGRTQVAAALLTSAESRAEQEVDAGLQRRLLRTRAYLTLLEALSGVAVDEARLRRSQRELESAVSACDDRAVATRMRLHASACRWLLGNRLVARRELEQCLSSARMDGDTGLELEALCLLGFLERRAGRAPVALVLLEEAASLASKLNEPATAFEASFEAHLAAREVEPQRAGVLLRRCARFHPFVRSRSVNALLYERLTQEA